MELLIKYWNGILDTSLAELLAVLTSVAYVILAAKEKRICWFFGFASAFLYVWICFDANLYLESILQSFYVLMAVYGWYSWSRNSDTADLHIHTHGWIHNLLAFAALFLFALFLGFLASEHTNQANPYTDAQVFSLSLYATYLVTKKILENWLYWIVIDAASIYLYYSRGLESSAILYVFFTFFAAYGFFIWRKKYQVSKQNFN